MQRTKNVKLCAYLKLRGFDPETVNKLEKGRAEYVYRLEDAQWRQLQVDFNKSEFLTYAQALEAIKDLAY